MPFDEVTLAIASRVQTALRERGETIAIAESCTGGLVSGALTAVGGASDVFNLGLVTYSDRAKVALLDVPHQTIDATGAVSGPTARSMATGVRDRLELTTWGLSITGIAGPTGGRPGKPVGTVYIGIAHTIEGTAESHAARYRFDGDRASIRQQTTRTALEVAATAITQATSSSDQSR